MAPEDSPFIAGSVYAIDGVALVWQGRGGTSKQRRAETSRSFNPKPPQS